MTIKEFYKTYKAFALAIETEKKVPYLVTLAQAGLESAWGKHAPGHNFFGIKAGKSWKGRTQLLNTKEFVNGKMISVKAPFRAYDTIIDCFRDYADVLIRRFPKAFNYSSAIIFVNSLQTEHDYKYATDPDYVTKITKIINTFLKLERQEKEL